MADEFHLRSVSLRWLFLLQSVPQSEQLAVFWRKVRQLLMRVVEVLMSIPSFFNATIKCVFKTRNYDASSYYRITNMDGHRPYRKGRNVICKEREYVLYAKVSGQKSLMIIVRHIILTFYQPLLSPRH